jgi:hypothetical protein
MRAGAPRPTGLRKGADEHRVQRRMRAELEDQMMFDDELTDTHYERALMLI